MPALTSRRRLLAAIGLAALALGFTIQGWVLDVIDWLRRERWEKAPLERNALEKTLLRERPHLILERIRFFSAELNEPRFLIALRPASGGADEVFVLNHGYFDRPEFLLKHLKVDEVYNRLLAQKAVRPGLVVIPDIRFPSHFRRNRNNDPFPSYLTLVAEEMAAAVSRQYGIPVAREKWSIGGFSFGGYVALDVTRRYSGRFGALSVISSFTEEDWTYWTEKPHQSGAVDAKGRSRQTVVDAGPLPRILLACGRNDRFYRRMQELHLRFSRLGIAHEWTSGPGGHTWKYWASVLERMFTFHLGF